MDKEALEILRTMQDSINTMQGNIASMQGNITSMQGNIASMQSDITSMQSDIKETNQKLERVESKTDKNTLMLEELNRKVEVVAEVQSSFTEQIERDKEKDEKLLTDKLDVIELAIIDTSSRVKDVQKDLSRVVRTTAENWAEIVELKSAK